MESSDPRGWDGLPDIWSELSVEAARADRHDLGGGSLSDYTYGLYPRFTGVMMRLAGSNAYAAELRALEASPAPAREVFIERRRTEEERIDAPMFARLWLGEELSGVVGFVPRGLEAPVDACLGRLSDRGKGPRIPAAIVRTRHGLRVNLLIGLAY